MQTRFIGCDALRCSVTKAQSSPQDYQTQKHLSMMDSAPAQTIDEIHPS